MAILSVIASILSVQLGASLAKGLFPILGPLATTMLRISLAAIILSVIWRPWRTQITKSSLKTIFFYGLCLGMMNLTYYLALTRIPLGICVALEFTGPLTVALVSSRKKVDFLWGFLAAFGILLILPLKTAQESLDPLGIFLSLVAGACWAFYIILGKKVGALVHGGIATSVGMICAALVTLPFGMASIQLSHLNPKVLGMAVVVAILSSAIPYSLEMFALKKIATKTFGIFMSLEPAVAALFGLIVLGEKLSSIQSLAILSVIIASAGSATTSRSFSAVIANSETSFCRDEL